MRGLVHPTPSRVSPVLVPQRPSTTLLPRGRSLLRPQAVETRRDSTGASRPADAAPSTSPAPPAAPTPPPSTPSASTSDDVQAQLESLRATVDAQSRLITEQQESLQLIKAFMKTRAAATSASPSPSPVISALAQEDLDARRRHATADINDRRVAGLFDARYHSASSGATPRDFRILPRRIILVRHAESEGNVDSAAYTYLPDPQVPLTPKGWRQALQAGERIRAVVEGEGPGSNVGRLFFYTSPYLRSKQTYEGVAQAFAPHEIAGVQEEVQLREQDFGNFQDAEGKRREKAERLRFGRFFYRFPNGESGADVYDRMTLFEDHLIRDINAGRFANDSSLVLLTHGLAARVFLMRWFHWTVDQFMRVYNPPNAVPVVLERLPDEAAARPGGPVAWVHTKALYRLSEESMEALQGCTPDMCQTSWMPRSIGIIERKVMKPPEVHPLMEVLPGEEEVVGMVPPPSFGHPPHPPDIMM